jgi:curli biogenesis system outer membrane secretion channel CsgG
MKRGNLGIRAIGCALLVAMLAGVAGCATMLASTALNTEESVKELLPSGNLQAHAVRSIKQVRVNTIAVMPVIADPGSNGDVVADGGPDSVTAELYTQAAIAGGWDVVPQDDVLRTMTNLPPSNPGNLDANALKVGHALSADGVLYGMVERYREREGLDYAAASPASVAFVLKFVDMKTGQIVWTAKFAKAQKALSQNVFELANFVQHEGRWVRAHEIAQDGVTLAVNNLHGDLTLASSSVKRFETGTYSQQKSGQQRYSTGNGPNGIY